MATEGSYFLDVAQTAKYLGQVYHQKTMVRASDYDIIAYQRPVGWSFFSYSNVEFLLSQCRQIYTEIIFPDISDTMAQIYEENAAEMFYEPEEQTAAVKRLNELFFERWVQQVKANTTDERMYMEMLGNPNTVPSYPENVRKLDKTVIPNESDLSTYSDNQGVHFDPEEDALFKILKETGGTPAHVAVASIDDPNQY